eukprot:CAMPEP_0204903974 /NCGR_PEP_ID=MMETSP1397-20131031/4592_1 /ASSEMBLY_ACC=CAM_ASM_000891 /TAXON_ID=49980 /ORGANISM="Climacostomum Climacostomum virens, Strain Stock W-24" /LENGTH=84 /DNA_ID=CAMNT_0052072699 /DNA_START=431 /DNA_END=683 /DNA_ORIENTATION=-
MCAPSAVVMRSSPLIEEQDDWKVLTKPEEYTKSVGYNQYQGYEAAEGFGLLGASDALILGYIRQDLSEYEDNGSSEVEYNVKFH